MIFDANLDNSQRNDIPGNSLRKQPTGFQVNFQATWVLLYHKTRMTYNVLGIAGNTQ